MRQLSLGVFRLDDSFQQAREPRLVRVGHWDLIRPARLMDRPVFGWGEDELLARLVGLSQHHQVWVTLSWEGFRHHINRDARLPQPAVILMDLRERHRQGDVADPDLTRFPVNTALEQGKGGISALMNAYRRLVEDTTDVVQVHREHGRGTAISLHPRALRRILELQR